MIFVDMNFRFLRKHYAVPNNNVQSTPVISKSKGLSIILRDIHTSTYQICRIEEKKTNSINHILTNICVIGLLKCEIYWKYYGKEEQFLLFSTIFYMLLDFHV